MIRLNLMPPELREEIALSKRNAKFRQYVYYAVMTALGLGVLMAVIIFILFTQKEDAIRLRDLANQQIKAQDEIYSKANDLYLRLNLVKKIKKDSVNWSLVLNEIGKQVPAQVQIDTVANNKVENRVKLTGLSESDHDTASLKENLANSGYFNYVDIESVGRATTPSGKEVRSFVISFSLRLEKVKN